MTDTFVRIWTLQFLTNLLHGYTQSCLRGGLSKGLIDGALYNINNTPFIMTGNLIATGGTWTLPPGFQRAYWSTNLVDFSGLQWQSASVNWMGAEGLQWQYLMKRSCMSGDDINKAKGQPSSSPRSRSTLSRGLSSHPRRPPSGKYASAARSSQMSAYALHTVIMLSPQWGGGSGGPKHRGDPIPACMFGFFALEKGHRGSLCKNLFLLWLLLIEPGCFPQ